MLGDMKCEDRSEVSELLERGPEFSDAFPSSSPNKDFKYANPNIAAAMLLAMRVIPCVQSCSVLD